MTEPTTAQQNELVARLRAAGCVFAEDEASILLTEGYSVGELEHAVRRRESGEPLEHIVGWAEFCGLRVAVAPGVFVPRQRTRCLVERALSAVRATSAVPATGDRPVVLDLCCGSGAIGLAVHAAAPGIELHAADVDPVAVACARQNLAGVAVTVSVADLFDGVPTLLRGACDVIVANVPYVPTERLAFLPVDAREHEPPATLDGGVDGLELARRLAAGAAEWLAPGGTLLIEVEDSQRDAAMDVFRRAGLAASAHDDEDATIVVGVRQSLAEGQIRPATVTA